MTLDYATAASVLIRKTMKEATAHPPVVGRDFGLTWQDPCSREAHWQCHRALLHEEPEPGSYDSDPPSVTRPPPGWVPPPLQPRPIPPPQQAM